MGAGYSASGGDASSGTGDQSYGSSTSFGGLNYGGEGVSPWLLIGLAGLALVFMMKK